MCGVRTVTMKSSNQRSTVAGVGEHPKLTGNSESHLQVSVLLVSLTAMVWVKPTRGRLPSQESGTYYRTVSLSLSLYLSSKDHTLRTATVPAATPALFKWDGSDDAGRGDVGGETRKLNSRPAAIAFWGVERGYPVPCPCHSRHPSLSYIT